MAIDRRGTGPFKVEKETTHLGGMMAVGGEEPELVEVVEISDAEGNPFAYVLPEDCSGKDLQVEWCRALLGTGNIPGSIELAVRSDSWPT